MRRKVIKAICSLLVVTLWGVSPVYAEETDNQQQETTKEETQETEKTVEEGEGTVETDETIQPTPSTAPEGEETEKKDTDTVDEVEKKDDADETVEVTENEATKVDAPEESVEDEAYTVDEEDIMTLSAPEPSVANNTTLTYCAHVQDYGWMNPVTSNQVAGTTGQSKRVEALKIGLPENLRSLGDIRVETHVQDYGWIGAVGNNQVAGTTGQSKRVEALKVSLTGELANQYDVIYRVHVQDIGWQNWVRNGRIAGTTGQSKRIEAIQIYLRNKADRVKIENVDKTVSYSAHVQDYGWLNAVTNGNIGGTVGQSKRMEAIQVSLSDDMLEYGDVNVQAHVQDYGWLGTVGNGQTAGTTGQNKRLEGLKITLTDELANHYDIYYRAHVGNIGWLGWTKNGGIAGSVGCNRRIEAVQIAIYAKNDPNAPKVGNSQTTSVENPQYTPTYYSQRDPRWAGATYNGYNLQSTGCVPTAVAMVVDGILHNGVTPNIMADYLVTTGEFAGRKHGGSGLAIRYGAEHWGLKTTGIGDYGTLVNCLNAGNIVVFQVGAGTFTSRGSTHAIVLFRNSDGNTYVYDPWNAHNGWYSISMIWNQRSTNSYDLTGGYVGYGIYQ